MSLGDAPLSRFARLMVRCPAHARAVLVLSGTISTNEIIRDSFAAVDGCPNVTQCGKFDGIDAQAIIVSSLGARFTVNAHHRQHAHVSFDAAAILKQRHLYLLMHEDRSLVACTSSSRRCSLLASPDSSAPPPAEDAQQQPPVCPQTPGAPRDVLRRTIPRV